MTRHDLGEALEALRRLWAGASDATPLAPEVRLATSHRGAAAGRDAVAATLRRDLASSGLDRLELANVVLRARGGQGAASAYFHADLAADGRRVIVGGPIVLALEESAGRAVITEIGIQISAIEGDVGLLDGWILPALKRQWRPGDRMATVCSEFDAPWHRIPTSDIDTDDAQAIAEAWYRYAWALDQADYTLLTEAFTDDATADLTPMGHLTGRRELVATLKAFRMPWPWMQHSVRPLSVEIAPGGSDASMILGRIIPGHWEVERRPIYGAHYDIGLRRDQGSWRIARMEYRPGWISAAA